ncbi:MAG: hypothetical protein UW46_C0003G0022 [Candidatus Yanofskybacteria bacterium GW2011_GWF1_44_227]|uniref:Uncharacterized protein n=1 Tax=Candidatus Yanofskybacteria bacterium GW2011_GWE2_40_11 TaxID=1619033 RepID=A0A0G0QM69_9BACT|nr:MAG: hypothetical protein UT69_C0008G0035 [Candidatus Yanofskybacteria bacterium GW2011_GWE1_40_10]KKR41213.1 MAG: hypothetical protein UT75_C0001G0117 [Candidatus Yanofskybacteria bacterium GW2011_GWE2_40_11]KKT15711.1 MAG: hypothetical protein UV97_C0003G0043 [Candidatus Yanofskybacteria bacterium GW2011_GWF2_43_596]KKT53401.1 MAG: hypothetical protein UW46_C0003G0022 [Candidatus Yanofskybacteria bacterium GW2011_GWF1_44_227]OGN36186.1 MAG: hypothetical protein A2241_00360 [Candidatus Yano
MAKKKISLQAKIARRREQAEDKDISGKASAVARYLGSHNSLDDHNGIWGNRYFFENSDLKITHESGEISGGDGAVGFFSQTIYYKRKLVFDEGGAEVVTYIPGKWEEALDALESKALQVQKMLAAKNKESSRKKQETEEVKERKKWGL